MVAPDPDRAEQGTKRNDTVRSRSAFEHLKRGNECRVFSQLFQFAAHDLHSEEKQSQTEDRFSQLHDLFVPEIAQCQPQNDGRHNDHGDLERDQLHRDGRSDIGSENDPDGLLKGQKTGIDEPAEHDGRDARRLRDRGDDAPGKNACEPVGREKPQNAPHFFPCSFLQSAAHQFHPEQEQRETAKCVDE